MKTKIEMGDYCICVEEQDGVISVKAEKDEETVEEFSIDMDESGMDEEEAQEEEIQDFDEYDKEEDEDEQDEAQDEDEGEAQELPALESFQSFINRK
jgi:hypothetical protein